jgi:YfiH family protein
MTRKSGSQKSADGAYLPNRSGTHGAPAEGSVCSDRGNRQRPAQERENIEIIQVASWVDGSFPSPGAPWLVHGFSTRSGAPARSLRRGAASGPARACRNLDFNLGFTQGASREAVMKNRERFLRSLCGDRAGFDLVTIRQVHSSLIWRVGREAASAESQLTGDGLITDKPGLLLGILTADCVPVLVADLRKAAVGAFHAGWRGAVDRIVEKGVGRMRMEFGSRPEDLVAAIGPRIGPCCYPVGEEVRQRFEAQFDYAGELFREVYDSDPVRRKYPMLFLTARAPGHSDLGPATHLDLADANRRQLMAAGLRPEAIHSIGECTSCSPRRFFSYRREQALSGRMMSVIGIRPSPGSS